MNKSCNVPIGSQVSNTTNAANAPPTLRPNLLKDTLANRTGAGQYLVNYSVPTQAGIGIENEQVTSFVFRIEGNSTVYISLVRHLYFYVWKMIP